ncbi:aminomethyl transferase family protein [Amycolatopsis pithecellobii]|uniref:Aminomethyl transferase family protein n=1 Tax=Amycolatopsis pithecellobii TaxID=664692 RepID=A0A6N7YLE4_9PSEU|nr:aminomethyl transferase family protein [Amycolatopsis pithecellobii]MTD53737.1 aminomethyl transferase family protein [Amycolatopsis pithecellobii]
MSSEKLQTAVERAGGAVPLLRNSPIRPHTFPVAAEFSNWRTEQSAWRDSCALLDQSHHMTDLFISGPGALRLLREHGVNSFANFAPGKAKQYVAVNPDGYFIGDAVLFYLDDELFDIVGHPMVLNWLQYNAEVGQYDVTLERDENSYDRVSGPPKQYRYELQGPNALKVLESATNAAVPDVKFFNMADFEIAGHRVRGLRHGMAGQPGFELFGPWAEGDDVLAALLAAGRDFDLVRAGAKAYSTANLESAWIPSPMPAIFADNLRDYREWLDVKEMGSLGGSMDSTDIADYYVTPYDIGYGRIVVFDHEFVGREALEAHASDAHRTKVTLVWNSDDVAAAIGTLFEPGTPAKYIEMPKARYALFHIDQVLNDGELIGLSMDAGYLANEHLMASLATLDSTYAEPGTELTLLWGEKERSAKPQVEAHRQIPIRVTVAPAPYVQFARSSYRSARLTR